jgi:hypothetical protein
MYAQEERRTRPGNLTLVFGYLLNLACAFGCGFAAVQLAPPKGPWDLLKDFRAVGFAVLMIAAIYFFQRGLRLIIRFQSDRAADYYSRTAPMSLGLNPGQADSEDQVDDREL